MKSIRSFQRKWWIIQRLYALSTHTLTYWLSNTMIMMISQYSPTKANVTSFETLKLFTQYILHQHIYSISPSTDVSMEFDVIWIYIYIFLLSREIKERKRKVTYSFIFFFIFVSDKFRNEYLKVICRSVRLFISKLTFAMSVGINASQFCPIDETTRSRRRRWVEGIIYLFLLLNARERKRENEQWWWFTSSCSFRAILRLIVFCLFFTSKWFV